MVCKARACVQLLSIIWETIPSLPGTARIQLFMNGRMRGNLYARV